MRKTEEAKGNPCVFLACGHSRRMNWSTAAGNAVTVICDSCSRDGFLPLENPAVTAAVRNPEGG